MFNLHRNRRPRPMGFIVLAAAIGAAGTIIAASASANSTIRLRSSVPQVSLPYINVYSQSAPRLVQDSDDDADSEIPPDQVEKYVAVYKDMQRDRSLTVDTAAAKEGLSVAEFRELEQKIERDDSAREHVRIELQGAADQKP